MSSFKEGFTLTEGQKRGYEAIASGKHVLLLGTAGSGKSTLMDLIRKDFGHETVFGATTGVANQNLFNGCGGGGTAHSIFSLPRGIHNKLHEGKVNPYTQALLGSSDTVKRICIDEAGMLTPDQFCLITKRLKRFNKKTSKRDARNIQLILVADLLQIPPVLADKELEYTLDKYKTPHFFMTEEFKDLGFEVVMLNQVMRQTDNVYKDMLDVIRFGKRDRYQEVCDYFNKQVKYPLPKDVMLLTPYNKNVDKANEEALARNLNPCGMFKATVSGRYDMRDCPVDEVIKLKVGLPCITMVNHPLGLYQNGSSGIVDSLSSEGAYVKFDHTGEVCLVEPFTFEATEYAIEEREVEVGKKEELLVQKTVGRCTTLPLRLAAGLSIHKAQGKTIRSKAIVDLGWGFNDNTGNSFGVALCYVALSRFTDVNLIYLTRKLTPKHIKVDYDVIRWLEDNT